MTAWWLSRRGLLRYSCAVLLALAAASCGAEPTAPIDPPPPPDLAAELANRLQQGWSTLTPGLRGVSVAIVDRNGALYTATAGTAGAGPGAQPLDAGHRFRVASVSKPFAAALILKLVEQGRLGLDDRLTDHWPDAVVPNAGSMTLRQLLSHTAGVFDHLNANTFWNDPQNTATKVWALEEIVGFAVRSGPLFAPGASYGYSNTGICILGGVVERVLGKSYRQAMAEVVTGPLGLTATFYDDSSTAADRIPNLAESNSAYRYHASAACAAGAMVSTPMEMARFGRQVYGARFLGAATVSEMTRDLGGAVGGQPYGLGTRLWTRSGIPYHGHTGALMDYRTILMYVPWGDLTIAMATHDVHANWTSLIYHIFDFAVGRF